jgi:CelD/BcsL family acetyltransferase involved in cellulose biosynthesis
MIVELNIDDPGWLEFVSTADGATAFHHPAWARLLMDTYGYRAFAFAVVDRAGTIGAGLPVMDVDPPLRSRRLVSLPYTDACAPLSRQDAALDELAAGLDDERERRAASAFEIRGVVTTPETRVSSAAVIHTLRLTAGADAIRRGFKSTVRQDIAKANRLRLSIRRATAVGDVADTFFRLQLRTRRRLGVPMQPRRYFVELWRRILEPGLGFCLIAESERRPVASGIFLAWRGTLIHKYGASDERFLNLRPNHFLLWEAIRWGAENGYDVFDFGRTDHGQDGLRRFKSSWGAREDPLLYSSLGDPSSSSHSPSTPKLLTSLIRYSPPVFCRALGELLYRYAA